MPVTKPVAIVGLGAIMPDANDAPSFWENIKQGRYSIRDVPSDRWNPDLYYDSNPSSTDKTYSKIGGWVTSFKFDPFKMGIAIPPRVLMQMDEAQQWGIAVTRQVLDHFGYPKRALDLSRTAVIVGNALSGERHYITTMRIRTPEFMQALRAVPEFQSLPPALQEALVEGMRGNVQKSISDITEDTMPGELGNVIAGRIANVFNFQGPNFVTDAACASSLAALHAAVEGLNDDQFDAVITGGIDRNMGVEGFVKFSKIGALSADGSRPYADGANGFVMGEGAGLFLLKRLEDAERDGDTVYGVIRGIGSSSDGKGKGITAPNPTGQQQAIARAWKHAGVDPKTVGLIEGHGTSTRVGDVVEVNSLNAIFGQFGLSAGRIALGSVKSNIGHLKSAAGAAGMLKVVMALHEKVLPPSVNYDRPNPNIEFGAIPLAVNTQLRPWEVKQGEVRRAGISSFGFGGTNFHVVMEEYIPGMLSGEPRPFQGVNVPAAAAAAIPAAAVQSMTIPTTTAAAALSAAGSLNRAKPYRGLFFLSDDTSAGLQAQLTAWLEKMRVGVFPPSEMPDVPALQKAERLSIDYGDQAELLKRAERALQGFTSEGNPWQALVAHGVFRGHGAPGKIAFLFPGQGSQYVNMLKDLCEAEPMVKATFDEADRIMTPIFGRSLTSYIYVDGDEASQAEAEKALRNTEITQPAMLTANVAMLRLMEHFGYKPDIVAGHSLGEYAALVSAGVLSFAEALEVVSARGREMKKVSMADNGCMAAVSAPIEKVEKILEGIDGYVVIANKNSPMQSVIGGATAAVDAAMEAFKEAGFQGTKIPVSHAFHTKIVEPASEPLRSVIARMNVQAPNTTVIANVTGDVYPKTRDEILDILAAQVASPVQFVKSMQKMYDLGARIYVEVGPKRVLNALSTDNLKGKDDVAILATNHPREGAVVSFNKALCGLLAAGVIPAGMLEQQPAAIPQTVNAVDTQAIKAYVLEQVSQKTGYPVEMLDMELDLEADLGIDTVKQAELFATIRTHYSIPRREDLRLSDYNTLEKVVGFMEDALRSQGGSAVVSTPAAAPAVVASQTAPAPVVTTAAPASVAASAPSTSPRLQPVDGRYALTGSVVVSGAGLGLPGRDGSVFDDSNVNSILEGSIRIEALTEELRSRMLDRRVTRLNKSEAGAVMVTIDSLDQTIKLGGQRGVFDLTEEFGVPADRVEAIDISTKLAIAAGIEALRDAGIPLVMAYRQTSRGTYLPDRWRLPEALADETGVVFGSAFPGLDEMAAETANFYAYQGVKNQLSEVEGLLALVPVGDSTLRSALVKRQLELQEELKKKEYSFDRRFIFRILSMGHSQFAEYIGARGPNTHVNAACATTTHAISVAEDWIRSGRARRVIVIAGDDVTSGPLADWIGTGLMASGAATTEGNPRMAILPFDRRRNGMIMGMGAAALVLESEDAVRERGMRGICEVLSTQIANSAFHGTRLDVHHVSEVMNNLVKIAEERFGINRDVIAPHTVFVSHETYTPARGGSAAAEIRALRSVFGGQANQVVIANTKGYTGHTMGVGVEDVVAVKALETGLIPAIANVNDGFEPDPDLGDLRLSKGGRYNPQYALRLGAGFGSQIAMTLMRKVNGTGERVHPVTYQNWLNAIAGYDQAEIEVEKRTLRVRHMGQPVHTQARSNWKYGQVPMMWVEESKDNVVATPAFAAAPVQQTVQTQPAVETPVAVPVAAGQLEGDGEVKAFVLQAVAEKTGYPVEMLDLELDLEADLGIDTVKQAELFATIRTHYGIARREDLRLSDYNTLAKVIGFMRDAMGSATTTTAPVVAAPVAAAPVAVAAPVQVTQPAAVTHDAGIKAYVLQAVAEKTGYPVEMLDLELDLEADLGIDTVKQAELFATIRTHYGIPRREDLRLSDYNTLTKVIGFMQDALGVKLATPAVVAEISAVTPLAGAEISSAGQNDDVKAYVLQAVAEKTGYPVEMLDLELDLEADLGIDTVKQAELFATIRTHYGIPRREDLRLSDYNTLTKVIGFMTEALEAKVVLTEPQAAAETVVVEQPGRLEMLLETPTEQTIRRRVTIPVMRPRLDLCSPSKVTLDSSSRVIIVADSGKVGDALARKLRARKAQVLLVPVKDQPELTAKAVEFASQGAVTGVYYLCGLDAAPALDELTQQEWENQINKHGLSLFQLVKALNGEPFLVSATRMGGLFGTDDTVNPNPFGGAISGFTKALSRERPDTLVKVVDFDASAGAADIAAHLMAETLADPSLAEVGVRSGYRFSLGLMEQDVAETGEALPTNPVVVVSGGSGGITAPVVLDMARNLGGTYYLLGRTPLPDENDHDLVALRADRNAFKADMGRRLKEKGEKATPAAVDQKIAALERAAATMETIAAGRKAGAEVNYVICDVTRMEDCVQTIQNIVEKSDRVDVLVHAAGLERSRKVETKPDEEFIQTVAVKASGFYNLYKAMQAVQRLPKAVAFFSSVAGRFGNTGQTDYAAANDLLNKFAVTLSRQEGGMRVVSIDWGAWAEVGMASRGYIPELMKRAGIELMHPAEAAPVVRKELLASTRGEIVISGALGVMEADSANVGLDLEKANQALTEGHPIHIMLTRATGFTVEDGVILEADLDPESEPFLKDHTMNGTPLLPGVMGIEGLSTAARHIASTLASPKGSLKVSRLEDIQFKTPFKFYKNQARRVTWKARGVLENGQMVAYASLESSLARLGRDPEVTQHFSAKVYLVPVEQVLEEKFTAEIPHWNGHAKLNAEEIYTLYFHGPAFQVLEAVQKTGSVLLGKLNPNLPNFTSVEQNLSMSPVLVELCLQTAGVWEVGHTGTMALPGSIGSLSVYHNEVNGTPIYAEVTPRMQENQQMIFDARVVDAKGRVYVEMKDYATIQMPYAAETDKVGPIQKWIELTRGD